MQISQICKIVNDALKQTDGNLPLLQEDLSNIIDVGNSIFNANSFDNYVKKLVDRIGKVVFVIRPYSGLAPSIYMDSVIWGSVTQKSVRLFPKR